MVQVTTDMTLHLYILAGDGASRESKLTPSYVLCWFSGAVRVLAEGFDMSPRKQFRHMEQQQYPDAIS